MSLPIVGCTNQGYFHTFGCCFIAGTKDQNLLTRAVILEVVMIFYEKMSGCKCLRETENIEVGVFGKRFFKRSEQSVFLNVVHSCRLNKLVHFIGQ